MADSADEEHGGGLLAPLVSNQALAGCIIAALMTVVTLCASSYLMDAAFKKQVKQRLIEGKGENLLKKVRFMRRVNLDLSFMTVNLDLPFMKVKQLKLLLRHDM